MFMLRKFHKFTSLETNRKKLLIEAFFYLVWARVLKSLPFSKITPLLGNHMEETTKDFHLADRQMLWNISDAVNLVSLHTFWESKCLVKAIAAMKMLERRKVGSTLYLGTAKDEFGKMIAHAWLRSGPFYITGGEEKNKFVIVGKFAKHVKDNKRRIS